MPAGACIARATIFLVNVPLRVTVEHALASRTANATGFLVLESADGATGIGELVPRFDLDRLRRAAAQIVPVLA